MSADVTRAATPRRITSVGRERRPGRANRTRARPFPQRSRTSPRGWWRPPRPRQPVVDALQPMRPPVATRDAAGARTRDLRAGPATPGSAFRRSRRCTFGKSARSRLVRQPPPCATTSRPHCRPCRWRPFGVRPRPPSACRSHRRPHATHHLGGLCADFLVDATIHPPSTMRPPRAESAGRQQGVVACDTADHDEDRDGDREHPCTQAGDTEQRPSARRAGSCDRTHANVRRLVAAPGRAQPRPGGPWWRRATAAAALVVPAVAR